jgi:hypothetical protein
MKKLLLAAALLLASVTANSALVNIDFQLVGYRIHSIKLIKGYIGHDGRLVKEFTGCEYDRTIIFDDNTSLKCAFNMYGYGYIPEVVIFTSPLGIKMLVNSIMYDMKQ